PILDLPSFPTRRSSDLWAARLDELNTLLTTVADEYDSSDQTRRLAALYGVSRALGSSLQLDEVLNQVMDAIIELTGAERGFLMLDRKSTRLNSSHRTIS